MDGYDSRRSALKLLMVHLDTNFLISAIESGSPEEAKLEVWLNAGETLGISAVAWAEFFAGPVSNS